MRPPVDPPTSFRAELRLIPPAAWVAAGLLLLIWYGLAIPFMLYGTVGNEMVAGIMAFMGIFYAVWLLLICYTNVDAARRGMGRLLPTILVAVAPFLGFIGYILVRKQMTRRCPGCGTLMHPDFVFCSACGTQMEPACPTCHAQVDSGWAHCASCGTELRAEHPKPAAPPSITSIS